MIAASDCPYGCAIWDNNLGHGFCAYYLYDCDVAGNDLRVVETNSLGNTIVRDNTLVGYFTDGSTTEIAASTCPYGCALWSDSLGYGYCG